MINKPCQTTKVLHSIVYSVTKACLGSKIREMNGYPKASDVESGAERGIKMFVLVVVRLADRGCAEQRSI